MSVPVEMNVVEIAAPGGPEQLKLSQRPVPAPKEGEVLVRVAAAGVNRPDVMQRQGRYPPPPGASDLPGLEIAGEIAALGPKVSGLAIGEAVTALLPGGGYAAYAIAAAPLCLPVPAGISMVEAAAIPETFFTVWTNLFDRGRCKAGDTVLIHGGTSGIGTTAIALAQAFGAHPIATAGSDAKCAACEKLGARAINYRTQDFVEQVRRLTEGRGVDVVLDMVAGSYLSRNLNCLARDGRLVVIAVQGGTQDPEFNILPVMLKRLSITGSTLRPRTTAEKAAIAAGLREKVWPLLNQGHCAPLIHATFPLAEVAAAHTMMESGAHIGKIVLTVEQ
jgi:putative PIG3 family NAD(P)H quinone oxidoreductase